MGTYKYKIVETLSRVVEIEAENEGKAFEELERMYYNADVVLNYDDFEGVEFYLTTFSK